MTEKKFPLYKLLSTAIAYVIKFSKKTTVLVNKRNVMLPCDNRRPHSAKIMQEKEYKFYASLFYFFGRIPQKLYQTIFFFFVLTKMFWMTKIFLKEIK